MDTIELFSKRSMSQVICGLDEAGRGPLAGPVVAAAVILPPDFPVELLDDSKKLSEQKRKFAEEAIKEKAIAWAVALATPQEIDRLNILQASLLAMRRAYMKVKEIFTIDLALVDGNRCPSLDCTVQAIVGGDALVPEIMAASILAKNQRDRYMQLCHAKWPQYDFASHKGYPTPMHRKALEKYGPCPIHRLTFTPVKQLELF